MAHRVEPEPPLDWPYLVKCVACLGLMVVALYGMYIVGWVMFGNPT